jgi:hypothetical protein
VAGDARRHVRAADDGGRDRSGNGTQRTVKPC